MKAWIRPRKQALDNNQTIYGKITKGTALVQLEYICILKNYIHISCSCAPPFELEFLTFSIIKFTYMHVELMLERLSNEHA